MDDLRWLLREVLWPVLKPNLLCFTHLIVLFTFTLTVLVGWVGL